MNLPTMKRRIRARRGMSLMEILLVIAIIAVFLIGGLALYVQANASSQAQRGQQQLMGRAVQVRDTYSAEPGYANLTTQAMLAANAVPSDMQVGGGNGQVATAIRNAWGGFAAVTPGNQCGGDSNGNFCVVFANVPQSACVKMLTTGGGPGGFVAAGVTAGSTNSGTPSPGAAGTTAPITVLAATQACVNPTNIVTWMF